MKLATAATWQGGTAQVPTLFLRSCVGRGRILAPLTGGCSVDCPDDELWLVKADIESWVGKDPEVYNRGVWIVVFVDDNGWSGVSPGRSFVAVVADDGALGSHVVTS